MSAPTAERAAAVAQLRERIARLGGAAGSTAPRPRPRHDPDAVATRRAESARRGGFEPHPEGDGVAWVRRVSIDLGPFLERAGAPGPATAGQLIRLALGDPGPHTPRWDASAAAVLDLETLGLRGSGVLAFLAGVGIPRGDRLEVDQVLLVDPADERAALLALLGRLAGHRVLVTYNGRSFDVPALRSRLVVNRLDGAVLESGLHCDVLAPVRRLFRDRLGACTLGRAERDLLGFVRHGEVPGSEAPARYQAWLRGAGYEVLEGVVIHNQLDLCGTMVLAARLAAHLEGDMVSPVHPADRYRLAVHLARTGIADSVDEHLRATVDGRRGPWDRHAAHALAARLRRRGGVAEAEAVEILAGLWRSRPGDLRAARALAVSLERLRRHPEALAVAERALELCSRLEGWRLAAARGAPTGGWVADWERRRRRLRGRIAAGQSPPPGPAPGAGVVDPAPLLAN
ncbi:MAG TPA: ribonuclease H-like domain-containing protein [Candidatus Dormibacteraeota bacterium]|nr:ribonuclease H-like domain-containing protein [Candidatus Dormibacteraeota bacterium]